MCLILQRPFLHLTAWQARDVNAEFPQTAQGSLAMAARCFCVALLSQREDLRDAVEIRAPVALALGAEVCIGSRTHLADGQFRRFFSASGEAALQTDS